MADARDQLREYCMMNDDDVQQMSESTSTAATNAVFEQHKPVRQRRIRPGGRVERLMKRLEQERMMEDLANAREFAKAVCEMHINPKVIDAQKSGNV